MGITAKEVIDALKAAQNRTAVKGELAEVKMAKMSFGFGLTPGDRAGLKVGARRRRT
jgi:hypothetical protein